MFGHGHHAPASSHQDPVPLGSPMVGFIDRPSPEPRPLGALEEQPLRVEDDPDLTPEPERDAQ